jgi:hypothetical protein
MHTHTRARSGTHAHARTRMQLCPPSPTESARAGDAEAAEPDLDVPNAIFAEWCRLRCASAIADGAAESVRVCSSVDQALDTIRRLEADGGDTDVLVTGSLYVVGQTLAYMKGEAGDFAELRRVNFGSFSTNDFSPVASPIENSPSSRSNSFGGAS